MAGWLRGPRGHKKKRSKFLRYFGTFSSPPESNELNEPTFVRRGGGVQYVGLRRLRLSLRLSTNSPRFRYRIRPLFCRGCPCLRAYCRGGRLAVFPSSSSRSKTPHGSVARRHRLSWTATTGFHLSGYLNGRDNITRNVSPPVASKTGRGV